MDLGRYAQSLRYFEESIAIWRQLGDDYTRRIVLWNMGEVTLKLDRLQEAQAGRRVQAATLLCLICDHSTTTALDREEAQAALEKVRAQMAVDDDTGQEDNAGNSEDVPSLDAMIGAILSKS